MGEIILFIVATLPVVLIGKYIYDKDKEKESSKILTKLFLGGILSCFLVLIVSSILGSIFPILSANYEDLNFLSLVIYVFIGVALVEEGCKWVVTYFVSYNYHEFDTIYDMIIYGVFVALGFAFFENLFYVYENGVQVGLLRAILAIPGHACDGVFMGYYLGLAKVSSINNRKDLEKKNIVFSVVIPVILHGIYDYCLMLGNLFFILIFIVFIIFLYNKSLKKIKKLSSITRKIKYKDNYCSNCGLVVNSNFCPRCGKRHE